MTRNKLIFSFLIIFGVLSIIFAKKLNYYSNNKTAEGLIIATYIEGELSNGFPKKEDGYDVEKIECSNNAEINWNYDNWGFYVINNIESAVCNIYFDVRTINDYDCINGEQEFTAHRNGLYKLEVWGAEGGSISSKGGAGAYSSGYISLNKGDKLYVNVGGTTEDDTGGYNGGGSITNNKYGGGGATHIAKITGLLSSLENAKDDLLIVAAGGGGEGNGYAGGSGGGISGNNGNGDDPGKGGTQSYGGAAGKLGSNAGTFGQGGSGDWHSENLGGGGGGYYGGSSGGGSNNNGSGGGGSGYIGNSLLSDKAMYCYNCTESSEEGTKTISTICNEKTPTENCAKKGNGYAKITFISEN